ncbi:MAG: helix-turn-helix domain-containing protein, partial [Alphaproteobacteria bacterium]|nr:helix-turn-helix domain-containing protein [Alphaproteobacteria bacterium]
GHLFSRDPHRLARDGIDHFVLQLYRKGRALAGFGERRVALGAGDLFLFDLAQPSDFRCADFANSSVILPRAFLDGRLQGLEALHGHVLPDDMPLVRLLRQTILALPAIVRDCAESEAGPLADAVCELAVRCLGSLGEPFRGGVDARNTVTLQAIKRLIETRLGDPGFGSAEICATFRLSRSHLYAMFAPMGGVARHIMDRRLRRSAFELQTATGRRRKIAGIAFEHGFTSESHFCRCFRRAFGCSPSEARALRPGTLVGGPDIGQREYEAWVTQLGGAAPPPG